MIPEDRPFDVEAWNNWVSYPPAERPPLTLAYVERFNARLTSLHAPCKDDLVRSLLLAEGLSFPAPQLLQP